MKMRKKIQQDGTLEAMREYVEHARAEKMEHRELGRRGTVHEPVMPERIALAVTHPLRPITRDAAVSSAAVTPMHLSQLERSQTSMGNSFSAMQLSQIGGQRGAKTPTALNTSWNHPPAPAGRTFFVKSTLRRQQQPGVPAASFDGFGSSPLPQDVSDPIYERSLLRAWCERYSPASGLPVHVWATALAKELDAVVSPNVPRPHGLRAAVSMHVAKSAFSALQIPEGLWTDLVTAVYAANSSHDRRAGELADEGWLNRVFSFQAMEQCRDFAEEMKIESDMAQTRWKSVAEAVTEQEGKASHDRLSLHFHAWRRLNRLDAWRYCAMATKEHAFETKWVRRCFDAWRQSVKLSKAEAELEELSTSLVQLQRSSADELRRTIEDKDLKAFNERLRYDAELKEARRRQVTEEELAANNRLKERAKQLDEKVDEMTKVRLQLELQLKDAGIFKEQSFQALTDAVVQVRKTFRSAIAGRQLGGIKASDLVVNAERALRGEMTEFRITSKEGSDIVSLPLQCRAEHLLLAFVNHVVETSTGTFPGIAAIGPPMADGVLYAHMAQHVFDKRPVFGATMLAEPDTTKRVEFFLAELDAVLVAQSGTDLTAKTQPGQFSPLQSAGITAADFLAGVTECHAVIVCYFLLCYARSHTINVVANLKYASFILDDDDDDEEGDNAPRQDGTVGRFQVTNMQVASKVIDELTVALHLINRSTASWRLVTQHVEDQLLALLASIRRDRSHAFVLRHAKDSRLVHFTFPKNILAPQLPNDDADDHSPAEDEEVVLEASPSSRKRNSNAKRNSTASAAPAPEPPVDEDTPEYLAYRALEDMIPHSQMRNAALRCVSKHLVLIANLFSHYAKHKLTMTTLDFDNFASDLRCAPCLPAGETMNDFFKRHARYDRSKGVYGIEFVTLLVDVAAVVVPRVATIAQQGNTLEAFLGHFVIHSNPHPMHFSAVAEMMQTDRSLSLELNAWRKVLKQLLVALTAHISMAPQTAPVGGSKKKGAAPKQDLAAAAAGAALYFADFAKFCTDLELLNAAVTPAELQLIADSAKRRLESRDAVPPAMTDASFSEALVAISMYHFPSPFMSQGSKFRKFLVDVLLPKLRAKLPTVASALPPC